MRKRRLWRTLSTIAILIGLLGGLALAGYALFWQMAGGLASAGCGGGGCEDRLKADDAHYQSLLYIAVFVGGGLVAAGIATKRWLAKRLAEDVAAPLPARASDA